MSILTNWMHSRFGGKRGFFLYCKYSFHQFVFRRYENYMHLPNTPIKRVVFVCKGNICRSAFAEAVFKTVSDLPVCSFGLDTTTGCPAHPPVIDAASKLGYDLSTHSTTNITEFISRVGDLYVCMEVGHISLLEIQMPTRNLILLGAKASRKSVHIHDPYSGTAAYIDNALNYIKHATINLGLDLERLNK